MLRWIRRARQTPPQRLAVLAGTYNPPTVAHVALAREAAARADEVLLVLPEALPHKRFEGVPQPDRLAMMEILAAQENFSVGCTPGGLFLEIAEACATSFPTSEIALVCGKDAAERILSWNYSEEAVLERLFRLAKLWVFARQGTLAVPSHYADAIECFDFDEHLQALSATEVRQRIASGKDWRPLVPASLQEVVERLYATGLSCANPASSPDRPNGC